MTLYPKRYLVLFSHNRKVLSRLYQFLSKIKSCLLQLRTDSLPLWLIGFWEGMDRNLTPFTSTLRVGKPSNLKPGYISSPSRTYLTLPFTSNIPTFSPFSTVPPPQYYAYRHWWYFLTGFYLINHSYQHLSMISIFVIWVPIDKILIRIINCLIVSLQPQISSCKTICNYIESILILIFSYIYLFSTL